MLSRSIRRVLPLNRRFLCHHRDLDIKTQINELNLKIQKLEDDKVLQSINYKEELNKLNLKIQKLEEDKLLQYHNYKKELNICKEQLIFESDYIPLFLITVNVMIIIHLFKK